MTNRGVKRGVKLQIAGANLSGVVSFTEPNTKASRRRIALPRRLADGLTQHLEAFPFDADGLLFTAPEGGNRYDARTSAGGSGSRLFSSLTSSVTEKS